ncbi:type VI secretion protein [Pseudomonas pergaminensis]|uniref:Type VI secretion protein n=1 Tax=Pseudomonas pergaminensis TaxID=2853159 RepID=A0ABD8B3P7_9PSED|nr:type VI secretion protein [Pseudomonas pergaminensis]
MPFHRWQAVVLVLCLLSGCNANYVFDDADYRPLGDPEAMRRGQLAGEHSHAISIRSL